MKNLSMIAAVGENLELGYQNQLLCHLPVDLKHFKEITSGHAVIMGDRTWDQRRKRGRKEKGEEKEGNEMGRRE